MPPLTSLERVAVFFDGVSADGASVAGLALSTGSGLGGVLITGVNSAVSPLVLGCNLLVGFVVGAAAVVLDVLTEFLADVLADVLTGGLLTFLVGLLVVLVVFVGVVLVVLGLVTVVAAVAAKDKDKFNETIATVNADRVSTRDSGCR